MRPILLSCLFWEFKVMFVGELSGHSASPLLDLSGRVTPSSSNGYGPRTKCFHTRPALLRYNFSGHLNIWMHNMQSRIAQNAASILRAPSASLLGSAGVGSGRRSAAIQSSPTKHILLMTATVTPHNAPNLARTDPAARLKDYDDALGFYLGLIDRPLHGIVFVENSDSDVTTLRQLVASRGLTERVEFLCNYGVHLYSEKGRAHGEFKLLDYAMTTSIMVLEAGVNHVVWKITGRYMVKNLASIIASAPRAFDAYVDMKDHPRRWMDMRLMAWTSTGYDARLFAQAGSGRASDSALLERTLYRRCPRLGQRQLLQGQRTSQVLCAQCRPRTRSLVLDLILPAGSTGEHRWLNHESIRRQLTGGLEALHREEQGMQKDREIQKDAAVLDVVQVILDRLMDAELAVTTQLPQAGQALRNGEPAALERCIGVCNIGHLRTRTDQRHLSHQNIQQLRELIQAGSS
jgi:hypothetical protein